MFSYCIFNKYYPMSSFSTNYTIPHSTPHTPSPPLPPRSPPTTGNSQSNSYVELQTSHFSSCETPVPSIPHEQPVLVRVMLPVPTENSRSKTRRNLLQEHKRNLKLQQKLAKTIEEIKRMAQETAVPKTPFVVY